MGAHGKAADHDNYYYHLGSPGAVVAGLEPRDIAARFQGGAVSSLKSVKPTNTALPVRAVLS